MMNGFGKKCGGGRRAAPRATAPLVAVISTLTETHSANLLDISATGVRLSGDDLPAEGEELFLTIENVRAFGCIAWKRDGECGVAFEGPLPGEDVDRIRKTARAVLGVPLEMRAAFDDWTAGIAR